MDHSRCNVAGSSHISMPHSRFVFFYHQYLYQIIRSHHEHLRSHHQYFETGFQPITHPQEIDAVYLDIHHHIKRTYLPYQPRLQADMYQLHQSDEQENGFPMGRNGARLGQLQRLRYPGQNSCYSRRLYKGTYSAPRDISCVTVPIRGV